MASCNTNNSRFFSLTKHKIRYSAKLMLCEYVTVVYTSIQNNSLVQHIHWKQFERFCGKKQSFKMFNDIIPTMYIEAPKWEFWVFLPANPKPWKINKIKQINSKSTLLHALRTVGGGIDNNLNDMSQLPHLADFFSLAISYNLWTHRGVTTLQLHFYIVDSACTVTARDSANSQTCWKWGNVWNLRKLHTLVEIIEFLFYGTCTTGSCSQKCYIHLRSKFSFFKDLYCYLPVWY